MPNQPTCIPPIFYSNEDLPARVAELEEEIELLKKEMQELKAQLEELR